jgi:DNA-binding CsgD family transcriptional regulator
MPRLRTSDLLRLNEALAVLHADVEPATLFARLSRAVGRAVACEVACFDGFDEHHRMAHLGAFPQDLFTPDTFATLVDAMAEHPLFEEILVKRQARPVKITDVCPSARFRRTALYNDYYRPYAITNQLVVGLDAPGHGFITCAISRHRRDFTEADRTVFGLLKPHFLAAMRNARTVARLRQGPAAPLPAPATGLARINAAGGLLSCDATAERLLRTHFGPGAFTTRLLPGPLLWWLHQARSSYAPPTDFSHHSGAAELGVRLVPLGPDEQLLVLEERVRSTADGLRRLGLTPREAQILQYLAQGLPDKEISRLCGVSPRTVQNHLQNIYAKLQVDNRTAALCRALGMAG